MNNEKIDAIKICEAHGKCESPIPENNQLRLQRKKNVQSWRSPTGESVEREVKRVRITEDIKISTRPFSNTSPSGPFLETLIGICFKRPSYIRAHDVARHASMLDSLLHFQTKSYKGKQMSVQDIPIQSLDWAVCEWIMSFFDDGYHQLMPIYAMDTAHFIVTHGYGGFLITNRSNIVDVRLPEMVPDCFPARFMDDPDFLGEFDRKISDRGLVLARVPQRCAVIDSEGRGWLAPGAKFLFQITRCFMNSEEPIEMEAEQYDSPNYEIHDSFLPGKMWWDEEDMQINSPAFTHLGTECLIHVPLHWISHSVQTIGTKFIRVPVPQWK
jgi:hypothetical protein